MKQGLVRYGILLLLCYGATLLYIVRIRRASDWFQETTTTRRSRKRTTAITQKLYRREQSSILRQGQVPQSLVNFKQLQKRSKSDERFSKTASGNSSIVDLGGNASSVWVEHNNLPPNVYFCKTKEGIRVQIPRVPDFIIGGTQKGGTTALLHLIQEHPGIVGPETFESHFFDRDEDIRALKGKLPPFVPGHLCSLRASYATKHFPVQKLMEEPRLLSFEKTPAYILEEGIPARIKRITPWAKVIFSLRNPTDRAFSHFQMMRTRGQTDPDEPFEKSLGIDLEVLRRHNFSVPDHNPFPQAQSLHPRRVQHLWKAKNKIYRGMYSDQLRPWLKHFTLGKNLMVVQFERMLQQPHDVLDEILDFLNVQRHSYDPQHLNKTYSPVISENGAVRLRNETRDFLKKFYKPHNEELADILGEQWRGIWEETYY